MATVAETGTRSDIAACAVRACCSCLCACAWRPCRRSRCLCSGARVDLVNLGVTVTDRKGELVAELTADDFEVFEDGRQQTVQLLRRRRSDEADRPELHLGLLLDVSGSMGEDIELHADRGDQVPQHADRRRRYHGRRLRHRGPRRALRPERFRAADRADPPAEGQTATRRCTTRSASYLDGAAGQNGRKIMVLYTDGGDTRSALRFSELLDLLKASDVTVYAIGVARASDRSRAKSSSA